MPAFKNLRAAIVAAATIVAGSAVAATTLPGGATTLRETYDQWVLNCGIGPANGAAEATPTVACSLSQQLIEQSTKRRAVALGLTPTENGGVKGTLIMPFGLALAKGVTLQIDEGQATQPISFRTCTPQGCLIPIEWPDQTVNGLKTAGALKVSATGDNGQPVNFTLSLKGFASGFDRAVELQK